MDQERHETPEDGVRNRKDPPLGHARAVRTIPLVASEPVERRPPSAPFDPALLDAASGLLPPTSEPIAAIWSSWSVIEQEPYPDEWTTPEVDGQLVPAAMPSTSQPAAAAEPGASERDPVVEDPARPTMPSASERDVVAEEPVTAPTAPRGTGAAWLPDRPAPVATSWVRAVAGFVEREHEASRIEGPPAGASPWRSATTHGMAEPDDPGSPTAHASRTAPTLWPPAGLNLAAVRDAMAQHPSMPARATGPPETTDHAGNVGRADHAHTTSPSVDDQADLVHRIERGASLAMNDDQLRSLAQRALRRLVPDGATTWLTLDADELLEADLTTGDDAHDRIVGPRCSVRERRMCPAMTTGLVQRFDRSDELDACPNLAAEHGPACAAVCVPVPAPGPLQGVLIVRTPAGEPCSSETTRLLQRTVDAITARLSELRVLDG